MNTAESATAIAARSVCATKIYGEGDTEVRALNSITIGFEDSRFSVIMGPSGSGKSTLMHCLAGLDKLTSGQVFIADTDLTKLNERQLTLLRREQVGFVFQAFNLIPTLSALENITLPMSLSGQAPDRAWIDEIVTTVGLEDRLTHRPNELSGGQQQRVAVSRALASKPKIIFADEPTGNLDSRNGSEILEFMQQVVAQLNQTIVMVTHDPIAASYADRVVFLTDGQAIGEMIEPSSEAVYDYIKNLGDE